MPVIQMQNAFQMQSSDEPSPSSSSTSNLLDSIKWSPDFGTDFGNGAVVLAEDSNEKRKPVDQLTTKQKQFHIHQRLKNATSSEMSHKTSKSGSLTNLTGITESFSASSEDISEAIGKTFGLFKANSNLDERSEAGDEYDVLDLYNSNSINSWVAPTGFRQWHSADDASHSHQQKQKQHQERKMPPFPDSNLHPLWSFDNPDNEEDFTRSERVQHILSNFATKTFESETRRVTSEGSAAWDEDASDLRDVSIMDHGSVSVIDSETDDDDDSDDYTVDTFQTYDTEHDDNIIFGGDQEGLRALGSVLYQLGTCTFDLDVTDDDNGQKGRSRPPQTSPPSKSKTSSHWSHPLVESAQNVLQSFSGEQETRRHDVDNDDQKPASKGIFDVLFSCGCGGPMP